MFSPVDEHAALSEKWTLFQLVSSQDPSPVRQPCLIASSVNPFGEDKEEDEEDDEEEDKEEAEEEEEES